jgi:hypothetical protein
MKKNILLAVCFLMPLATMAQNDTLGHERNITLSEAIVLARTQSVDAAVALNELKTAYWEYRTFRADLLPEVNQISRLKELEDENRRLKQMYADLALDNKILKDVIEKKL